MISDESGAKKKFYFPEVPKKFAVVGGGGRVKVDR